MKTKKINISVGRLIDGTGAPARRNVVISIENGIIQGLHDADSYNFDQGENADFSADTIIPGLIDSHVHLCMSGTNDRLIRDNQLKAVFSDAKGVIAAHIDRLFLRGVIAVRDGGDYGAHALRYKQECLDQTKSRVRIKTAGRAWRRHGRYGKLIGRPPLKGKSLGEEILCGDKGIDHVKIVNSGLNSLKEFGKETPPQFSLNDLKDAVKAASSLGLKVMVHANGIIPVEIAIKAGCASIEHGFFMGKENLDGMAEKGIVWVPTACTMKAYSEYLPPGSVEADNAARTLDAQLRQIADARELGVPVAVGTDSGSLGVNHGESVAEELALFGQAGYTPEEALKACVCNGSALLGLYKRGPVIKGNKASFIVLKGISSDLTESLQNIKSIYSDGKMYVKDETLQR